MKTTSLAPLLLTALLAACGGGGGSAELASSPAVAREAAGPAAAEPAPSKAPSTVAGYNGDGTLSPVVRDSMQHETVAWQMPPRQNARGFSLEDWQQWNATCEAQPQCQIPWADIEAYNRDVCEAHYPGDEGCFIGRPR